MLFLRARPGTAEKSVRRLSLTPYQLTLFPGRPAVNALLIHQLADGQSVLLGADALADVHIVDTIGEPDADVAFATHSLMEQDGDLFRRMALNALDADLPAGLIFNDFAVAKGQAFIISEIADGANIDAAISDVLHNFLIPFFWRLLLSLCVFIISRFCGFVKRYLEIFCEFFGSHFYDFFGVNSTLTAENFCFTIGVKSFKAKTDIDNILHNSYLFFFFIISQAVQLVKYFFQRG
jgi:hypothetical protein